MRALRLKSPCTRAARARSTVISVEGSRPARVLRSRAARTAVDGDMAWAVAPARPRQRQAVAARGDLQGDRDGRFVASLQPQLGALGGPLKALRGQSQTAGPPGRVKETGEIAGEVDRQARAAGQIDRVKCQLGGVAQGDVQVGDVDGKPAEQEVGVPGAKAAVDSQRTADICRDGLQIDAQGEVYIGQTLGLFEGERYVVVLQQGDDAARGGSLGANVGGQLDMLVVEIDIDRAVLAVVAIEGGFVGRNGEHAIREDHGRFGGPDGLQSLGEGIGEILDVDGGGEGLQYRRGLVEG